MFVADEPVRAWAWNFGVGPVDLSPYLLGFLIILLSIIAATYIVP